MLGEDIPYRLTPPDWIDELAALASERGYALYLVGGQPGVAERAAKRLREHSPNLQVAGTHHGYFDKTPGSSENSSVVEAINASRPHIVLVGFGMPHQEQWLRDNWSHLDANVGFAVGALFDYITGEVRRGSKWMTDNGLEWVSRVVFEPQRLWKRYLVGNPLFLVRVVKQRLRRRSLDHE